HWGLIPDMTGTFMLSRLVRPDIAKELVFSARIFSGSEAFALGVATRLSNDPLHDALALAAEIAQRSPEAIRGAKQLLNRMANDGVAEQFAEERRVIGQLIGSTNQVEAVMAHFEKRPASFS
ncbi:MAG: enoyl-CoA hydratase-related protein, partial [Ilumatobacteraceae bacterium]